MRLGTGTRTFRRINQAEVARVLIAGILWIMGARSAVEASSIKSQIEYRTTGNVGIETGTIGSQIVFDGVDDGLLTSSESFKLGEFRIQSPTLADVATNYSQPFWIYYRTKAIDGKTISIDAPVAMLSGWLIGSRDPAGLPRVQAIFDQNVSYSTFASNVHMATPPFEIEGMSYLLGVNSLVVHLSLKTGERTEVLGQLEIATIPESNTIVTFSLIGAWVALKKRRRAMLN